MQMFWNCRLYKIPIFSKLKPHNIHGLFSNGIRLNSNCQKWEEERKTDLNPFFVLQNIGISRLKLQSQKKNQRGFMLRELKVRVSLMLSSRAFINSNDLIGDNECFTELVTETQLCRWVVRVGSKLCTIYYNHPHSKMQFHIHTFRN